MSWFRRNKPKIEEQQKDEERKGSDRRHFRQMSRMRKSALQARVDRIAASLYALRLPFRLGARERLDTLFDEGRYEKLDEEVTSADPLEFVDQKPYKERIEAAKKSSGLPEAIVSGKGLVGGHLVYAGAMDMAFIGGSMGSAVGEKITRLIERAIEARGAVVIFSASGGARMQEGTFSLMQMAKISAALARLHDARLPFIRF
jgi:acetyl-CoA carboxylase carboxyl transferase subunit beta